MNKQLLIVALVGAGLIANAGISGARHNYPHHTATQTSPESINGKRPLKPAGVVNPFSVAADELPTATKNPHRNLSDTELVAPGSSSVNTHVPPDRGITESDADSVAYYAEIEQQAINSPHLTLQWITSSASLLEQQELELFIVHALLPHYPDILYEHRDLLTRRESRSVVDRSYAREFSETDPANAFAWAYRLEDEESKISALAVVAAQWARADHHALLDQVSSLENNRLKSTLFNQVSHVVASKLVSAGSADALNWIETLSEDQKKVALPAVFTHWVERDKDGARAWLQEQPDTPVKSTMVEQDFWYSLSKDIDHALALYPAISATKTKHFDYTYLLVSTLDRSRPEQVDTFIASLTGAEQLKAARKAVQDRLLHTDPIAYLALYENLDDDEKTHHLANVLTFLNAQHPKLISQWLNTGVPTEAELVRAKKFIDEIGYAYGC